MDKGSRAGPDVRFGAFLPGRSQILPLVIWAWALSACGGATAASAGVDASNEGGPGQDVAGGTGGSGGSGGSPQEGPDARNQGAGPGDVPQDRDAGASMDSHGLAPDVDADAAGGADAQVPLDVAGAPLVVPFRPWPSPQPVVPVDQVAQLGTNISGLAYLAATPGQPAALLAVQNSPSRLHRLVEQGSIWVRDPNGWAAGRTLRFASGDGSPDGEGLTLAGAPEIAYVASEGGPATDPERQSVLRFDFSAPEMVLRATHEWNLTADLPLVQDNRGIEAIAWVSDAYLVARGFLDERTGGLYQPSLYAGHGTGLFFVGLELNATIYVYALDHQTGGALRIATIRSGQLGVMDLGFDADLGVLWAECDDYCGNRATLLTIDGDPSSSTRGRFVIKHGFTRPPTLPKTNTEGMTFAPIIECGPGRQRRFFWSDDAALDGHALRMGAIPCDPLF